MKRICYSLLAVLILSGCQPCTIKGTIDKKYDGVIIYLVPMENASRNTVDSVLIENGSFEIKCRKERMSSLRLKGIAQIGIQELLVVTEKGQIDVSIDSVSSASGTPQNDSLQVWKDLNSQLRKEMAETDEKEERDALYGKFKARTLELAHNCGDDSTLAEFLFHLYPEN